MNELQRLKNKIQMLEVALDGATTRLDQMEEHLYSKNEMKKALSDAFIRYVRRGTLARRSRNGVSKV